MRILFASKTFSIPLNKWKQEQPGDDEEEEMTVQQLKQFIRREVNAQLIQVAANERLDSNDSAFRLIAAGRILQPDSAPISQFNIDDQSAVHVIRSASNPTSPTSTAAAPLSTGAVRPAAAPVNPLLGMDPAAMQQMMQSPLMQSITSNPELMRQLILSNPQMQQVIRDNPEIGQLLNDDRFIQQMMELSRNPNMMQEMMRNTDRTLVNIENMPGGFEALRRMYNTIEAPLRGQQNGLRAAEDVREEEERSRRMAESLGVAPVPEERVNDQPLPNPWAARSPTLSTQAQQQQHQLPPQIPLFGGGLTGGANTGAVSGMQSPFAALFGQFPQFPPPPQQQQQSGFNSIMNSLMSDPALMQQMMQNNPFLNMQQQPAAAANPPSNPFLNPFAMFGSGNQSVQTAVETAQLHQRQQPAEPPETRFASQLSQLEDMGFTNRQKNISALLAAGGNVNSAIEYLISSL